MGEFVTEAAKLNIEEMDAVRVFVIFDADHNGALTLQEFMDGLLRDKATMQARSGPSLPPHLVLPLLCVNFILTQPQSRVYPVCRLFCTAPRPPMLNAVVPSAGAHDAFPGWRRHSAGEKVGRDSACLQRRSAKCS